ncbi:MAG: DUF362 domain-containing protein, partial [Chitinivibrionales bacterium]|nr:DUF362 domain-containing protein [Chitinivibrionales bacterium]
LYDGQSNPTNLYGSFVGNGLPAGIGIGDRVSLLGGRQSASFPPPYTACTAAQCAKHIADGTIDILVNFAINKGHENPSGATLTMKNHLGTFVPHPPSGAASDPHADLDYIFSVNKSDAIVGGTPPRQRLCIIDSLWAMVHGPQGAPNKNTYRLIMGTFAPAVDYYTVKRIREEEMGGTHGDEHVARYLTAFGYSESDADDRAPRGFITVTPTGTIARHNRGPGSAGSRISVTLRAPGRQVRSAWVSFPARERIESVSIADVRGRTVRRLKAGRTGGDELVRFVWDGRDSRGRAVGAGTYLVTVRGATTQKAARIRVHS